MPLQNGAESHATGFTTGDHQGYAHAFTLFYRPLCRFAATFLKSDAAGEDLVADVFETLWRKGGVFPTMHHVKSWLYLAVRNRCLNYGKQPARQLLPLQPRHEDIPAAENGVGTAWAERGPKAAYLLRQLSPRCRDVFLLATFYGKSYKEIARIMGITPCTVRNHLARARAQLDIARYHLERRKSKGTESRK